MADEQKETLKESLLKNAPKSSWIALNFAIYIGSMCMLFLVTCVFILVLKTSIVTINLSTAKAEYFKDKTKIGKVSELLDKMEKVLTEPRLVAKPITTTSTPNIEMSMPDYASDSVAHSPSSAVPTPIVIDMGEREYPPPADDHTEQKMSPEFESLKQQIQELRKDEVAPSDAFQALE